MSLERCWNDIGKGKTEIRGGDKLQWHFVQQKSRTDYPEIDPGSSR
jgi:hypothetical protein